MASNDRMAISVVMARMLKTPVVGYFKVAFQNVPKDIKEKYRFLGHNSLYPCRESNQRFSEIEARVVY